MRNLGLDLLRFLAIWLVLGRHLHVNDDLPAWLNIWYTGGWIGVDLFFVLSGFLVSGLMFKEYQKHESVDIKRFLIRRGLKIYPPFYVLVAATMLVRWFMDYPYTGKEVLAEIFFVQNYFQGICRATWSLAVEEHFYIGIAILFFFLVRKKGNVTLKQNPFSQIPLICLLLLLACLGMRILTMLKTPDYSMRLSLFSTHLRIDSLFFGVFLSYLWHFRGLKEKSQKIPAALLVSVGLLLISPAFIFDVFKVYWLSVYGVALFYLGSGTLLLAAVRIERSNNPFLNLVGHLGASSYSIYLWHVPVYSWGWNFMRIAFKTDNYALYFIFYIFGSLFFGWLMNKLIEWPVLKARNRFFP